LVWFYTSGYWAFGEQVLVKDERVVASVCASSEPELDLIFLGLKYKGVCRILETEAHATVLWHRVEELLVHLSLRLLPFTSM
jgi:hypothetical protein